MKKLLICLFILATTGTFGALEAADYPSVRVGGFVATQYLRDESMGIDVNNEVGFKHARFHGIGNIDEKTNAFLQIETKTGDVILQNAFINLNHLQDTEIRAGYIKLPFGREAYGHPLKNPTIDISEASKRIYRGAHDMGVHAKYKHESFNGTLAVVNGNNGSIHDNNRAKDLCGRFLVTPTAGLEVGFSFYTGKSGADELATNRYGAEFDYRSGPLWVRGEFLGARDDLTDTEDVSSRGYYIASAYKLLPQVEAVGRWDAYDPDVDTDDNMRADITLGLNYYLTQDGWNRAALNYEIRDDEADEDLENLLTVQLQVLF
jgi:hypothetical protein